MSSQQLSSLCVTDAYGRVRRYSWYHSMKMHGWRPTVILRLLTAWHASTMSPYTTCHKQLNLEPLSTSDVQTDDSQYFTNPLIIIYRLANRKFSSACFAPHSAPRLRSIQYAYHSHDHYYMYSFFPRTIKYWNSVGLPHKIQRNIEIQDKKMNRVNVRCTTLVSVHTCCPVKGALYRIWCGVNRLGDSGVKVV